MCNNYTKYAFRNLFAKEVAYISTDVKIGRYVQTACENWDNYNLDTAIDLDNKNKDDVNGNIERGSLENLKEFYGVYD